jgi:tRNA A37 threonylcarbamoyladenosine dehydratase
VDALAKRIREHLKNKKSCTIVETELETVWPSEKIRRLEREKKIQAFADAYGLTAQISDPGIRVVFRNKDA